MRKVKKNICMHTLDLNDEILVMKINKVHTQEVAQMIALLSH